MLAQGSAHYFALVIVIRTTGIFAILHVTGRFSANCQQDACTFPGATAGLPSSREASTGGQAPIHRAARRTSRERPAYPALANAI